MGDTGGRFISGADRPECGTADGKDEVSDRIDGGIRRSRTVVRTHFFQGQHVPVF